MRVRLIVFVAVVTTFCSSVNPLLAADPAVGLQLAERWCEACHTVKPDQQHAMTDAPTFHSIAEKYVDAGTLTAFLSAPYPRMPSMTLSRDEIADLVAYIRTLGPKRTEPPSPPEKDKGPEIPKRG